MNYRKHTLINLSQGTLSIGENSVEEDILVNRPVQQVRSPPVVGIVPAEPWPIGIPIRANPVFETGISIRLTPETRCVSPVVLVCRFQLSFPLRSRPLPLVSRAIPTVQEPLKPDLTLPGTLTLAPDVHPCPDAHLLRPGFVPARYPIYFPNPCCRGVGNSFSPFHWKRGVSVQRLDSPSSRQSSTPAGR